jgi:energy-converting hydrogenase Eha subunit F
MEHPNNGHKLEQPPLYPRPAPESKADLEPPLEGNAEGDPVKFKKKALTKEEIIEIKDYVRGL